MRIMKSGAHIRGRGAGDDTSCFVKLSKKSVPKPVLDEKCWSG